MKSEKFTAFSLLLIIAAGLLALLPLISGMETARLFTLTILILVSLWAFYKKPYVSFSLSSLFLTALSLWLLMSVAWSADPFVSVIIWLGFIFLPLGYFITSRFPEYGRNILVSAALIAGLTTAGEVLYNYIRLWRGVEIENLTSFANPNLAAALLSLCFFVLIARWLNLRQNGNKRAPFYITVILVIFAAMILLGGRAPVILLVCFLLILLVISGKPYRPAFVQLISAMILIFMLATLAGHFVPMTAGGVSRFSDLAGGDITSIQARFLIWQSAWSIIKGAPILGHGFGTFYLFYPQARFSSEAYSSGLMAHNDPLQLWLEAGIIAPVLFYGFASAFLVRTLVFFKAAQEHGDQKILAAALFCGLCALFCHAHLSFPFYVGILLLFCGLMLGTLSALTKKNDQKALLTISFQSRHEKQTAFFIFLMVGAFFIYAAQAALLSHTMTQAARKMAVGGNIEQYAALVNAAHDKSHGMNPDAYILAAHIPIGILQGTPSLSAQERENAILAAKDHLENAQILSERKLSLYMAKAALAEAAGEYDEAAVTYMHALRLNPMHVPARMALAELYLAQGDNAAALSILEIGLIWRRSYHSRDDYFALTRTLASQHKRDDILQLLEGYTR